MTPGKYLESIEIENFRSIRGSIHCPLDAKVVLIHGENGAGKTSLLSAIELSLTGEIQSLERADGAYKKQLLHKGATKGAISTKLSGPPSEDFLYKVDISTEKVKNKNQMGSAEKSFFSDRSYLPQTLLSELLNIYQVSDNGIDSPLADFVNELIGLDRLDAIEIGLEAVTDIRNLRKVATPLIGVEFEKRSLDGQITECEQSLRIITQKKKETISALEVSYDALGLNSGLDFQNLNVARFREAMQELNFNTQLSKLSLDSSRLDTLIQEYQRVIGSDNDDLNKVKSAHTQALENLKNWQDKHEKKLMSLYDDISIFNQALLRTSQDPIATVLSSVEVILEASKETNARVIQAKSVRHELRKIEEEIESLKPQMVSLGLEKSKLSNKSDAFGKALSELTPFIHDENCPVCDRDYSQLGSGSLASHLSNKVRELLDNHNRIVKIGEQILQVNTMISEKTERKSYLESEVLNEERFAVLQREGTDLNSLLMDLQKFVPIATEGRLVIDREKILRQRINKLQSDNLVKSSIRQTASDFAVERLPQFQFDSAATPTSIIAELRHTLTTQEKMLRTKIDNKNKCEQLIEIYSENMKALLKGNAELRKLNSDLEKVNARLKAMGKIRDHAKEVISIVTEIRSETISHVFNRNLNDLWRDLFVRLAPNEPFIPAFHIPSNASRKIIPQLVTKLRDGSEGGAPGAMLSAGNLNTAALTLFLALHLTVKPVLPWLILDDPVQSMDDIHISHLASLLRTISKEHNRQIMIAVHDKQLFDYLALELSPAFSDDSLLLLKLYRAGNGDTRCVSNRIGFKEETALQIVA